MPFNHCDCKGNFFETVDTTLTSVFCAFSDETTHFLPKRNDSIAPPFEFSKRTNLPDLTDFIDLEQTQTLSY